MATLRAFRATDMRLAIDGAPESFSSRELVVSDGVTTTSFQGSFFITAGLVGFGPGFELILPRARVIDGTITGYEVDRLGLPTYRVDGLALDAFTGFSTLFAQKNTGAFQARAFAGNDTMLGSSGNDVLIGYAGNDNLWGYNGNDRLHGGDGGDTLYGNAGNDRLSGDAGNDLLWGGDGNDALLGGVGRDWLRGENGNDLIDGGRESDMLYGGKGADSFRFTSIADSQPGKDNRDQIRDFDATDLIDLRVIDANASAAGNQAFAFIGAAPFKAGVPGLLRFDTGARLLQGDTNGDGKPDFEVLIAGTIKIAADDFLL